MKTKISYKEYFKNKIFNILPMKRSILTAITSLMLMLTSFCQTAVISADSIVANQGDSVDIAIRAHNLPQIGSITLYIYYNTAVLDYGRAINIHPSLLSGSPLINKTYNTIVVSWADIAGSSIGNDKIVDLRFKYKGGISAVNFQPACEITDISGNLLSPNVVFQNGNVTATLSLSLNSSGNFICQGDSMKLTAVAQNGYGNYTYLWSSSPPGFNSALSSVWVKPSVNTIYNVNVSDGVDNAAESKLISIFTDPQPASVSNMIPANNTQNIDAPYVLFSWSPAAYASAYDLYVWSADSSNRPPTPAKSNITSINFFYSDLQYGKSYKWQVVSKNLCYVTNGTVNTFSIRALPELHVTQITTSQAYAGQPLTISWTVKNDGLGSTTGGGQSSWNDFIWISEDIEVRVAEDMILGQFQNVSYLDAGQSYTNTVQVNIPNNIMGSYYIFVVTDANDACLINWSLTGNGPSVAPVPYTPSITGIPYPYIKAYAHSMGYILEVNDNPPYHDNFFYKQLDIIMPPVADLFVNQIIPPNNVFSGQSVNMLYSVKNQGYVTATPNWTDAVYISADTAFNPATAILLGSFLRELPLQADSVYTKNIQINIPQNILGTYYLYIKTDATNKVFENVFEGNNISKSTAFQVFLTPPPDLIVTNIQAAANISNKETVTVSFTVKNQGITATTTPTWVDNIYLTNAANYNLSNAFMLKAVSHNGNLQPDASYSQTVEVVIPENISGPYYFYVKTDAGLNVFEYVDDSNNVSRQNNPSFIHTPDLIVTRITTPTFENNNQAVSISWTIKNDGIGKLFSKEITDKIFASKSATFYPDSVIAISSVTYTLNLNSGDSVQKSKALVLPANLYGVYYIYVYTDFTNKVYESPSELNNIQNSNNTIQVNKPDLQAISLSHSNSFNTGQSTTIEWKVKNGGLGNIVNKQWFDKLYLSKYQQYNKDSLIQIASLSYSVTQLIASDSIVKSLTFNLPDVPTGNYYLYIYTDANDSIYEGNNENNNTLRSLSTISVANPNLIVTSVSYPSTSNSGQSININWSTKNSGNGKLYYSNISDKIYLSSSSVFHPDSVQMLGIKNYSTSLLSGDSIVNQMNISIPNGISGNYYIFIHTNYNQTVYEGGLINDNKNKGTQLTISLSPWVDLQLLSLNVPDTLTPGETYSINFSIKNNGTKQGSGLLWTDKLYISQSPDFDSSALLLSSFTQSQNLNINSSYQNIFSALLPSDFVTAYYFIYAQTDVNNTVYEYLYENNNIIRSNPVFVKKYPVNLAVNSFSAPDSVFSGQNIITQWEVTNTSNKVTLPSFWYDAVYLSSDTILNFGNDILLKEFKQIGPLMPGSAYSNTQIIQIPNGMYGNYYMFFVSDYGNMNNEINISDNRLLKKLNNQPHPIKIKLTPSPDLKVDYFTSPQQCISGQPFMVYFKVRNQGQGSTSLGSWTDKIYLSTDFEVNSGDIVLGTYNYIKGNLDSSQYYVDSLLISIPVQLSGNYILIYKTDISNVIFEYNGENNNTSNAFILTSQPPPADIVVRNITSPAMLMVDQTSTFSWELLNIGVNPANGWLKDMVYLSSDSILDINDKVLGSKYELVSLPSLGTQTRSLTSKIPGVAVGNYYIIVKTDILNSIYENNDTNNTSYSQATSYIDMKRLQFNTYSDDTLNNNTDLYYLIEVPDSLKGESMLSTLKADSINASNEMYLKYDQLSSRLNYDFSHIYPYMGNQELLVPYLFKGNYYMMLYGRTLVSNKQEIKIKPEILSFEVRSINANKGGNSGKITVQISGSKFNAYMKISLVKGSDTIYAEQLTFVDLTKVYARFNLKDAAVGFYNVLVEHLCEGIIEIPNGFEVKNGAPNYLSVNAVAPNNVRANRITSFTVEYANLGNTDILAPAIDILSYTGSPIALNTSELNNNNTMLHIPLQINGEPDNILRPGVTGSLVIYTKTSAGLGFTITVANQ